MMGRQTGDQSQLFYLFNLEERIPAGHLLRRIATRRHSHPQQIAAYSITSSVRASRDSGGSRPRDFAVLRLITNSNLVECCTGSSPGFSPLRMRSTYEAVRR